MAQDLVKNGVELPALMDRWPVEILQDAGTGTLSARRLAGARWPGTTRREGVKNDPRRTKLCLQPEMRHSALFSVLAKK